MGKALNLSSLIPTYPRSSFSPSALTFPVTRLKEFHHAKQHNLWKPSKNSKQNYKKTDKLKNNRKSSQIFSFFYKSPKRDGGSKQTNKYQQSTKDIKEGKKKDIIHFEFLLLPLSLNGSKLKYLNSLWNDNLIFIMLVTFLVFAAVTFTVLIIALIILYPVRAIF